MKRRAAGLFLACVGIAGEGFASFRWSGFIVQGKPAAEVPCRWSEKPQVFLGLTS